MQGQSIIHATWLSNPAFYTILAPAGPLDPQLDQKHMVIVHDAKRPDISGDVFLPINLSPSGVRPPGAFTIALRGCDPAKILLVEDSTTADIGLVCCTTDDKWRKLAFDEGAPSMPLDADQNETTTIGFELDLKNTQKHDAKSVQLKNTPKAGTTTKLSFDWGPLPGIKPMTTIRSDLRSKTR